MHIYFNLDETSSTLKRKNHLFALIRHERSHTSISINMSSWQYMMHEVKKQIMDSLTKYSQKRDGKYLLSADQYDHYMAIMRIHTGRSLFTTWGKTASEKEFASKFVRTEIRIKPTATA